VLSCCSHPRPARPISAHPAPAAAFCGGCTPYLRLIGPLCFRFIAGIDLDASRGHRLLLLPLSCNLLARACFILPQVDAYSPQTHPTVLFIILIFLSSRYLRAVHPHNSNSSPTPQQRAVTLLIPRLLP